MSSRSYSFVVNGTAGQAVRRNPIPIEHAELYLHSLLPAALTVRLPSIDDQWSHFTTPTLGMQLQRVFGVKTEVDRKARRRDDIPRLFERFLESVDPDPAPALHFIHLLLPHAPWRYLPSGREYRRENTLFFPRSFQKKLGEYAHQPGENQVTIVNRSPWVTAFTSWRVLEGKATISPGSPAIGMPIFSAPGSSSNP